PRPPPGRRHFPGFWSFDNRTASGNRQPERIETGAAVHGRLRHPGRAIRPSIGLFLQPGALGPAAPINAWAAADGWRPYPC
ncbi:MAG: hypothetical protein ACREFJ_11700, partial [Acetobacteraceae bacterium]